MAYAIIQSSGHQFRVKKGDVIEIDDLGAEPGSEITFSQVLLVGEGSDVKVGAPHVPGASVTAEVVGEVKGEKVVAFKFKRRKGYHRTVGHRQRHTRVTIKSINV
jgi:large subunit ribosomal protein L21